MRGGASMKGKKVLKAQSGTAVGKSMRPEVITKDDILDAMIARSARMSNKKVHSLEKKSLNFLKYLRK